MRAIDTDVLVRLVTGDHFKQASAAEQYVAGGAWVSHLVLAESLWALGSVYDLDARALAQTVEFLLKHRDLTLQDSEVVVAALAHYQSRPSLGFSDCLMLEIARKAGHVPLGTFDRSLAKLDGAELIAA